LGPPRLDPPGPAPRPETSNLAQEPIADEPTGLLRALVRLPTFQALRYRQFRLLWYGQMGNGLAQWMDQVTRGWLLYELTNSAVQLGAVTAIRVIPLLIFSPIAGTLADRYGRKQQLILAQGINAVFNAIMAALILSGQVLPWHVYAVAIGGAIVQVFQLPARQVMTSDAVPPHHLTNAIGLNSVAFNGSRTVGPAVAGVLIAVAGTGGSYAVQAGLLAVSTLWTFQLQREQNPALRPGPSAPRGQHAPQHAARQGSFLASMIDGWRFVLQTESVRTGMAIMMLVAFFTWPFTVLLPIFAKDILEAGSSGQGFLLAGMGVGAFLSAVLVASLGDRLPKGPLMIGGAFAYGALLVVFAVSQWLWVSIVVMVGVGVANVFCTALVQTVVQAKSPPEMRGRVMGVYQQRDVFNTVGSMLIGALAAAWGAPWAMGVMAGACAVVAVGMYLAIPSVRTLR
jgi:MFS family permease